MMIILMKFRINSIYIGAYEMYSYTFFSM